MYIAAEFDSVDVKAAIEDASTVFFYHLDLVYWHGMMFSFELTEARYGVYLYRHCAPKDFTYAYMYTGDYYCPIISTHGGTAAKDIEDLVSPESWEQNKLEFIAGCKDLGSNLARRLKYAVHILYT